MALASDRPTQPISLNFEEFLAQYGDDNRYELIDGELFDLEPTGPHEEVAAAIARWLNYDIVQQGADYFIPHRCLIKPLAQLSSKHILMSLWSEAGDRWSRIKHNGVLS